ncbi:MAG: DUF4091 domain-containing protein [Clostridia bacterium]|nr:DUF4091 domain-containing protein [Clostridia bacterium]MBQ8719021.1 DUF4091 domain-containing protein [Clostridia bacterium]
MLESVLTSSLEKGFVDQTPADFSPFSSAIMLKNQHLSCQLMLRVPADEKGMRVTLTLGGSAAPYAKWYNVRQIPVLFPTYGHDFTDDNYLRKTPGLYPDLLEPPHYRGRIQLTSGLLHSVWITIAPEGKLEAGEHTLTVRITNDKDEELASHTLTLRMIDASLPEHGMILTQWFHCDCLASYYQVPVFSERHWEIIGNYLRTAVEYGQNMILTPLFTPPLDTEVGGERLTVQLVDVTINADGSYSFGYDKLDRWVALCHACGMRYFEMSHLFTQWGAAHAPKIVARVNGEEKRIFGWDTDAAGEEYAAFLKAFLPSLVEHLKALGIDQNCKFHLSDEPNGGCVEQYRHAKAVVSEALADYEIMDALSSFDFYRDGLVSLPIPSNDHIEPFLEAGVKGLWTYYCCVQGKSVSNRFIAMPSWRNRALGMQCFKYDIAGFLHWGFNFYNNMYSVDAINPYLDTEGEQQVPAGDSFMVYPAPDGTTLPSIRLMVFREGLEDLAAMKLCAEKKGKAAVVAAMEAVFGDIRFDRCPTTSEQMLFVRAAVDAMLQSACEED